MFQKDLIQGSSGVDVYRLQNTLEKFGFGDFVPTGFFGPKTKNAVALFQEKYHIHSPPGYFGEETRAFVSNILAIPRLTFYYTALGCLGTDASPHDAAPDEFGCAETMNDIHEIAFGVQIGGTVSTYQLHRALLQSRSFIKVDVPTQGDLIISPTGFGNGRISNGHVGMMYDENNIMSNSSSTGKFERNYTLEQWTERYGRIGGYPILFFRKI